MPRDMRAIVAQLQQHRPPVSTLSELRALTRDQLTDVLRLSRAIVAADDFQRAVAAISSADNSMQMPPPSMPSSAAASSSASSATVQPLNLHEQQCQSECERARSQIFMASSAAAALAAAVASVQAAEAAALAAAAASAETPSAAAALAASSKQPAIKLCPTIEDLIAANCAMGSPCRCIYCNQ
jgi:hypothetical protein